MTISYQWLLNYLPEKVDPERLSRILTSIGLEVESLERNEKIKGGLEGLLVGEVLTCEKHPDADRLKITTVDVGEAEPLQIVCGANNVEQGQKVIVAKTGVTIHPVQGEALTMKEAKIRGVKSQGMICAEDEVGLGTSHDGIVILNGDLKPGSPVKDLYDTQGDWVYEIGLTPNRMDAMSHYGVARDVCAYLTHHSNKEIKAVNPNTAAEKSFRPDHQGRQVKIRIEDPACKRYCGLSIEGVKIEPSPEWLQTALLSIGLRPVNNIVDITNYILHESGQPLHAFDEDRIQGSQIVVKKGLEQGFITLDGKERKLDRDDLMICDAEGPLCIAGVFGGQQSGVSDATRNIFLESAWFEPASVRRTSMRHGLRTDAAARFEKGIDISGCAQVIKRAAILIREIAGGEIASDVTDLWPEQKKDEQKHVIALKFHYLKKLSGKNYHPDAIRRILSSLGFGIEKEGMDELRIAVPFSKPDITLPADIVEEIMRIDGLDNIDIPQSISITPSHASHPDKHSLREKIAGMLTGQGFSEIMTNSITNSRYYGERDGLVMMLNSLNTGLDVLRPSLLETGLESIAYNINRKQSDLKLFEFGKTYSVSAPGEYLETEQLALFVTGTAHGASGGWRSAGEPDLFRIKGIVTQLLNACGIRKVFFSESESQILVNGNDGKQSGVISRLSLDKLHSFGIEQPVFFAELDLRLLMENFSRPVVFKEVPRFPAVTRDLAVLVDRTVSFGAIEAAILKLKLPLLQDLSLFDVFESDKLGAGKKSVALRFVLLDEQRTLTDEDVDKTMQKVIRSLDKEFGAEIRK